MKLVEINENIKSQKQDNVIMNPVNFEPNDLKFINSKSRNKKGKSKKQTPFNDGKLENLETIIETLDLNGYKCVF